MTTMRSGRDSPEMHQKERRVKRKVFVSMMTFALAIPAFGGLVAAQDQEEKAPDRLTNAAVVLKEIFGMPDSIPQDLLDKAECAIVFPSVKKVAVGIGGSYGRGVIT